MWQFSRANIAAMDISLLDLFLHVARQRSFAAVARDRGLDPTSVSRAVAGLEARLGVRLFERTTRAMVLTPAGEMYLARLPAMVEDFERLADEARSMRTDPVGTLRLTASVAFGEHCLAPLLPAFRREFPRLRLELLLTDANLDLVADRIDLAIRLGPGHRGDVEAVGLFNTRYRVVASPDYIRARSLERPADLSAQSCLLLALPAFRSRWIFRDADGTQKVPVSGDVIASNVLMLRAAALRGLGPALLADWLIGSDLRDGRLVDLFPGHDVTATGFETAAWLLYPSRDYLPRKTSQVIAFLKQRLAAPAG